MREIVLDTETTGLDPENGDRIVEIACLELLNHVWTGEKFHCRINPERPMPAEATRIHGITDADLIGQPVFAEIAEAFLGFIRDSVLVIHNAQFDLRFLNMEFGRLGLPLLPPGRAVDTVALARQRYPGAQASLDALCRRFGIDNSGRVLHGALLDCELLAEVYLELQGGRQPGLILGTKTDRARLAAGGPRPVRPPRPHAPTADELLAHEAFLARLTDPIWRA